MILHCNKYDAVWSQNLDLNGLKGLMQIGLSYQLSKAVAGIVSEKDKSHVRLVYEGAGVESEAVVGDHDKGVFP